MTDNQNQDSGLDPNLRERLLKESQTPLRGLRRGLWIALFGSAFLGFFVMSMRALAGDVVLFSDVGVQISALLLFGFLLWFDRPKD